MNKKYCIACGTPVTQHARFCSQCGLALSTDHSIGDSAREIDRRESAYLISETPRVKPAPDDVESTSSRWKRALLDPSTLALLVSNVVVIAFAFDQQWSLITLLWIYWAQSVIIGVFNVFKILDLTHFSTNGFYVNDKPVAPTEQTKRQTALFFAIHYGIFHLVYFIFLVVFTVVGLWQVSAYGTAAASVLFILTSIALFLANHLYSFLHNRDQERKRIRNIGSVMFSPYARIIPMQLTLILGVLLVDQVALILFLALKTVADVITHVAEHAQDLPTA
ncbi:MAG: zinc ribbon domain-containing protein [Euryarchaeota archaeon]|nr:zinc ribbon domain-containing protein [Euryarchaeota archaeon]